MGEQLIHSSQIADIFDRHALCIRLHKGMLTAKADAIHRGQEAVQSCDVPNWFWWAEGHEALEQNWESGDFATWKDDQYYQVFGARFPLSGLLAMLPFEKKPMVARSLSVAGNPNWVPARQARAMVFADLKMHRHGSDFLIEQASLGFIAARAISASGYKKRAGERLTGPWEEREWDVPTSFWEGLSEKHGGVRSDFELGNFEAAIGKFSQVEHISLKSVHYHIEGLRAAIGPAEAIDQQTETRGPKPKYEWLKATNLVWARIFEGDLIPTKQADIELALIHALSTGDAAPEPSTTRPFARDIWKLFNRQG